MEKAKYQKGEWTILIITDNGITIPAGFDDLGYATESGIEDDKIDIVSIFRTTA